MNRLPLYLFIIPIVFVACNSVPTKKSVAVIKQKDTVADKESELQRMREKQYVRSIKDTVEILKKFFNPDTIITIPTFWKHDTGKIVKVAIWKPDADAEFTMNVSEDGKCHTNIDTILEIPGSKGSAYFIVFTTITVMNDSSLGDCHSCGAHYGAAYLQYDSVSKVFGIEHFERNFATAGNFGGPGDSTALTDFGGCYALDIRSGFTQSGECWQTEEFYDVRFLSLVFTLQDYHSFDGWCDSTLTSELIKTMSFVPGKQHHDYKDIKISVKNTYYSKLKKGLVTENTSEYYTWNEDNGGYEPNKK